jgi:methylated-DNA-[protein]-cysteine S-methyltransferase
MRDPDSAARAVEQLRAYFEGRRSDFDLRLAPVGTPFQQRVWEELRAIPAGSTDTYGAIAARLGQGSASRAVGAAVGRNPISVIVPCHRVVGSDGTLTGYAGGLDRKRWLLDHETAAMPIFARAS